MRLVSSQRWTPSVRAQTAPPSNAQQRRCAVVPQPLAEDLIDGNPEAPNDQLDTIDLPLDMQGKEIRLGRDPTRSKFAKVKPNLTHKEIQLVRQRARLALPQSEIRGKSLLRCISEAEKKVGKNVCRRHDRGLITIDDAPAHSKLEVHAHTSRLQN